MTASPPRSVFLTFRHLNGLLTGQHRLRMAWYVAVSLVSSGTELFGVGLILAFIQSLSSQGKNGIIDRLAPLLPQLPIESQYRVQISLVAFLFGAYAVRLVIGLYYAGLRLRVSWALQKSLMNNFFIGVLHQPYVQRARLNTSDLTNHLTATIARVSRALQSTMAIMTDAMLLGALLAFLFFQEPVATFAIITSFAAVNVLVHVMTRRKISNNGRRETAVYARYMRLVLDSLSGFRELSIYGQAARAVELHQHYLNEKAEITLSNRYALELPKYFIETASVYIILAALLIFLVNDTPVEVFAQTLLLFGVTVVRILPSANRIVAALADILNCQHAVELTVTEQAKLDAPLRALEPKQLPPFRRDIRLDHVRFTYPGADRLALCDVSLTIHQGELIGVIGANGSGKTTLIETIVGLLSPDAGTLTVDGTVVTPNHARAWLDQIGYVSQECWLMDDTIAANIAFGRPFDVAKVEAAACRARLHDFIVSLPQGYDTGIGERGTLLSGGQRQRIGIARALYNDPALLVLDEATSALDPLTEQEICHEIEALRGQLTILMIAHRLNTLTACNRVLFVRQGEIVADGSLEEAQACFQVTQA